MIIHFFQPSTGPPRYFTVESQMNGKVLDIGDGKVQPGQKVLYFVLHYNSVTLKTNLS